jgi:NhaP-type Na+/H+ or K+/H+ antiporter
VHDGLTGLVVVLALGMSAQWLAWRLRVPAILLLLVFGVIAGPVAGWLDPDALIGDLLFPGVSLAVAVILFEGGLSLRFSELRRSGGVHAVWRLCTLGTLVTWLLAGVAAHWILGLSIELATLFGAVMVVTGPTVIGPLLRQVRILDRVASVLRWEGILTDPIGAILTLLVFEGIVAGTLTDAPTLTLLGLLRSTAVGSLVGIAGAAGLVFMLRNYYLPDFLQSPIALTAVGGVLAVGNGLQQEAGILAATVMGVALAGQRVVAVRRILEFKENLRVLFIGMLFIVLAARLELGELTTLVGPGLAYLAVLVLIVRPANVIASTLGSTLGWRERVMLMSVAPRGIVAAAVASVLAQPLVADGHPAAARLVPLTFFVIMGTITIYALAAPVMARWLSVAKAAPQGVLFLGAHRGARALAKALQREGFRVLLVDDVYRSVRRARMEDLPAHYGNILSEHVADGLELDGIGRLLALTPNDEANSLVGLQFAEIFGRSEVYQLAPESELGPGRSVSGLPLHLRGRLLFGEDLTYSELTQRLTQGAEIKTTPLSEEFSMQRYYEVYGESAVPMFLIRDKTRLLVFATDRRPEPRAGDKIIALVEAEHAGAVRETREVEDRAERKGRPSEPRP